MFVRCARPVAVFCGLIAGALFLCGCPAPPKASPRVTHLEPMRPIPVIPPVIEATIVPTQIPIPVPNDKNAPVLPEETLQLPSGLLPVSAWAQLCGFEEMRTLPNSNPPALELESAAGKLNLYLGQRFAKWNGINLGLGFPPVARNGQFTLHSIDVLKNAYPLGLGHLVVPKQTRVVVIDPGHGGADPGSRCATRSVFEKDLTLDWALRIERMLSNSTWRVVLTRRTDQDIPLLDRVAIADASNADLFVSLHFNSLEKSANGARDEAGIETYCLTPAGAPSNITRSFEDDQRRVYPNNDFDSQNILLAARLQENLIHATARRDRGVRRARFMTVVREQRRPAALIEGGFLSNPAEANQILQPAFREQMAQAVCRALPD